MGLIAGWLAFRAGVNWTQHARLFLTTGFLGGFTTFSAFSLDIGADLGARRAGTSPRPISSPMSILSIGGLFLGLWIVRSLG